MPHKDRRAYYTLPSVKAQHNEYARKWRAKNAPIMKDRAYAKLGNRCSNPACQWLNADGSRGCTDRRCLQIDHVRGEGGKERKSTTGYVIYQRAIADTENKYQLLCANCNWIKRNTEVERPVY